jgi:pseudouridine kinase
MIVQLGFARERSPKVPIALDLAVGSAMVADSRRLETFMTSGSDRILCLGGATIDRKYRALAPTRRDTSNPVRGDQTFGGVARNVAENLARLGVTTSLATLVGEDDGGRSILAQIQGLGVDTGLTRSLPGQETAEYVAILEPNGDLAIGLADMRIFESFDPADLDRIDWAKGFDWVFADCNLPPGILQALVLKRRECRFRLAIDAVSLPKVVKLPADLNGIDLLVLNRDEAEAYLGDDRLAPSEQARALLARGASQVIVTSGADGLVAGTDSAVASVPAVAARPVDVTGAGDSLTAAALFGLSSGLPLEASARLGALAAALTIESPATVRPDLSPELLKSAMHRLDPSSSEIPCP